MTVESPPTQPSESSSSWARTIHYIGLGLLIAGGAAYWLLKPASLNPIADPRAAEAIALVQTHRAQGAPTILQALTEHVRAKKARGEGVYLGDWRVQRLEGDLYEVRVTMREQGQNQWFERELIWHVDLATKRVNAASLPADGYMPADVTSGVPMRSPFLPGAGQ